jgi:hypothetical protein
MASLEVLLGRETIVEVPKVAFGSERRAATNYGSP